MKVYENGEIRDMTTKEIAALQESQLNAERSVDPLTDGEKIALMLAAIPEEPVPTTEPKVGYKWQPMYSSTAGFAWELVEDPNALGTQKNPLQWISGMSVKMGYHYTVDGKIYLALGDGTPEAITDETYFAEL